MIFTDREGCAYTRIIIRCQTDPTDVFIRAMNDIKEIPQAYRHRMVRPVGMIDRPIRKNGETLCLAAYVKINGTEAYSLFDSGSTTDAVTPDFTWVAALEAKELVKPVTLQLGCSGSHSKINFATESLIEFASIDEITYLDIVNLDKYDTILGTPFMRKHGISLDFERQEIVIRGKLRIPALPEGEGEAAAKPKTAKLFRRK
jgi:Retroviral aspartyl protease